MHAHLKAVAEKHLATLPGLFETLYVRKAKTEKDVVATYAVTVDDRLVYFKSVSIITGKMVDEGSAWAGKFVDTNPTSIALGEHYSEDYVRTDGLVLMQELCCDRNEYPEDAFDTHAVFGQAIYCADLDGLNLMGDDYISLHDIRAAQQAAA